MTNLHLFAQAADLAIKLPTRSTKEKDVRRILPVKLEAPLAKLPRKWDASALFSAEDDLHLVVIPSTSSACTRTYNTDDLRTRWKHVRHRLR